MAVLRFSSIYIFPEVRDLFPENQSLLILPCGRWRDRRFPEIELRLGSHFTWTDGRTELTWEKHRVGFENGKTFLAASSPTFPGRFESHMQMKATFQFPNESATNLIHFTGRGPPYPRGILSIETKIPIFIPPSSSFIDIQLRNGRKDHP